jgi:hypothetical protein
MDCKKLNNGNLTKNDLKDSAKLARREQMIIFTINFRSGAKSKA